MKLATHDSYERETSNNQKRIIRELSRIGDVLEKIGKIMTEEKKVVEEMLLVEESSDVGDDGK